MKTIQEINRKRAIALFIKKMRKERGLSQYDLARLMGISIGTIQGYEQGRFTPKLEYATKLSQILGVPLKAIYSGGESENLEYVARIDRDDDWTYVHTASGDTIRVGDDIEVVIFSDGTTEVKTK